MAVDTRAAGERSFWDDVKVSCWVLLGAALAYLLLGANNLGLLLGALVGCVQWIVGINVVRRVRARWKDDPKQYSRGHVRDRCCPDGVL